MASKLMSLSWEELLRMAARKTRHRARTIRYMTLKRDRPTGEVYLDAEGQTSKVTLVKLIEGDPEMTAMVEHRIKRNRLFHRQFVRDYGHLSMDELWGKVREGV
jgi:hypothetical protein